jgi:hypothetical protein
MSEMIEAKCRRCGYLLICTEMPGGRWSAWFHWEEDAAVRGCRSASFERLGTWDDSLDRKWYAAPERGTEKPLTDQRANVMEASFRRNAVLRRKMGALMAERGADKRMLTDPKLTQVLVAVRSAVDGKTWQINTTCLLTFPGDYGHKLDMVTLDMVTAGFTPSGWWDVDKWALVWIAVFEKTLTDAAMEGAPPREDRA